MRKVRCIDDKDENGFIISGLTSGYVYTVEEEKDVGDGWIFLKERNCFYKEFRFIDIGA